MTCFGTWLFLLQIAVASVLCQQAPGLSEQAAPIVKTEKLDLYEDAGAGEGEYHFRVTIPGRLRSRHFELQLDRSVCRGKVSVNGAEVPGENLEEVFRMDRSNRIAVKDCLERKSDLMVLLAYPKVFVSEAKAKVNATGDTVDIEVTIRNTLLNSVSCNLTILDQSEDFFVGPQTSQTRSFSVRLLDRQLKPLTLELFKFAESMEGAYRHIRSLVPTRIQP